MLILNRELEFHRLSADVKGAFDGTPTKTLMPTGAEFCRFITANKNHTTPAAWWFPKSVLRSLTRLANRTGAGMTTVARYPLAVTIDWNPGMEWLCIIQLQQPVYGLLGKIRAQPMHGADRSILLMGGLQQVYMPGLADETRPYNGEFARTIHFGKTDNLTPWI